jgi:hypothetical protein
MPERPSHQAKESSVTGPATSFELESNDEVHCAAM